MGTGLKRCLRDRERGREIENVLDDCAVCVNAAYIYLYILFCLNIVKRRSGKNACSTTIFLLGTLLSSFKNI